MIRSAEPNIIYDTPTAEELPEGWEVSRLSDIADINMGQSPPGSTYNRNGKGLPFFQGKTEFGSRSPAVKVWCSAPNKIANPGDVLLSVRAPVGPTNVADQQCAIGRGLAALSPLGGIPTDFLLNCLRFREPELALEGTGSTFTAINRRHLDQIEISVPPLAEQVRILSKIDELQKGISASREHLSRVPNVLRAFRQSVLVAACSGLLTQDWRGNHKASESSVELLSRIATYRRKLFPNREACAPDSTSLPEKPEEWVTTSIDALTSLVTSGSRGWAKYYAESGPCFIRSENINTDKLDLSDVAHVQPPKSVEGTRTRVDQNDILVTITGANVTKAALVSSGISEAYVSQHVSLVRPCISELAAYLYLWIVSPSHGRKKLTTDAYGAGKPGLNLENIRVMPVALPSGEEQTEIVRRVEILFNFADRVEEHVEAASMRADNLTRAVLAKAFRGELVVTEADLSRLEARNYEPASALLERIKAKRNVAVVQKKVSSARRVSSSGL